MSKRSFKQTGENFLMCGVPEELKDELSDLSNPGLWEELCAEISAVQGGEKMTMDHLLIPGEALEKQLERLHGHRFRTIEVDGPL